MIEKTVSVCPVCLRRIDAGYTARNDKVYFEKTCPEHGFFSEMVWKGIDNFLKWTANSKPSAELEWGDNCPYDCGICESHRQTTCCVLLEVTERCNLNCPVCFASAGDKLAVGREPELREIDAWYDMLMEKGGPYNIQLSGGEPALRDDLPEIIAMGRNKGFTFFQINTNGIRIGNDAGYLKALADSGLNTVFLQFDGLSKKSSLALRGADLTDIKMKAIENCGIAEVGVVLVPTVVKGVNDCEIGNILEFTAEHMPVVRGVHFQPVSFFGRYKADAQGSGRMSLPELLEAIEEQSDKKLRAVDFSPSKAEHPLCGFHADYTVKQGQWQLQNQNSGGDSCCCVSSDQAREAVARKWSAGAKSGKTEANLTKLNLNSLDDYLREKSESTLAVSGMVFQDAWTLDLNRLRQCYIHVVERDCRLIPFCAYNLSAKDGTTLYRGK